MNIKLYSVIYLIISALFVLDNTLYWDNVQYFDIFDNSLKAIQNHYEFYIWEPNSISGYRIGYYSIIGAHGYTFLFNLVAVFSTSLNKIGISITNHTYYVLLNFLIIPVLFLYIIKKITLTLFNNKETVSFVVSLFAISPIVILNYSDPNCLERLLYFLVVIYYLIKYDGSNVSFIKFIIAYIIFLMGFGYYYIFYMIYFLPIIIFLILKNIKISRFNIYKVVIILSVSIYFLYYLYFANQLGTDLISTRSPSGGYAVSDFIPGNFLELVTFSTPFVGYEWIPQYRSDWKLVSMFDFRVGYSFICIGGLTYLLYALKNYRRSYAIVILLLTIIYQYLFFVSGYYSPIINFLAKFNTAITKFNHYNDLGFRAGSSLLVIALIGYGFDYIEKNTKSLYSHWGLHFFASAISICIYIYIIGFGVLQTLILIVYIFILYKIYPAKDSYTKIIIITSTLLFLSYIIFTVNIGKRPLNIDISKNYIINELFLHKTTELNQPKSLPHDDGLKISFDVNRVYVKGSSVTNPVKLPLAFYSELKFSDPKVKISDCEHSICINSSSGVIDGFISINSKISYFIFINIALSLLIFFYIAYGYTFIRPKKFFRKFIAT